MICRHTIRANANLDVDLQYFGRCKRLDVKKDSSPISPADSDGSMDKAKQRVPEICRQQAALCVSCRWNKHSMLNAARRPPPRNWTLLTMEGFAEDFVKIIGVSNFKPMSCCATPCPHWGLYPQRENTNRRSPHLRSQFYHRSPRRHPSLSMLSLQNPAGTLLAIGSRRLNKDVSKKILDSRPNPTET